MMRRCSFFSMPTPTVSNSSRKLEKIAVRGSTSMPQAMRSIGLADTMQFRLSKQVGVRAWAAVVFACFRVFSLTAVNFYPRRC